MEQKDYRLAAIMYTDIVGYSRMMEKDEAGTLEILRFHNELVTDIAVKRHGTVIKTIGDAFLVDFRNTVEALQCAMEIQDAVYAYNKQHEGQPLLMRIGVHLGDIYFFENDALGEGINIAARLQSFSRPGCICFSQDVYNQVLNKIDFRAEKLGKVSLKNITKEIHAYEIASLNVEFDPNKDKPRPGYKPALDEDAAALVKAAPVAAKAPMAEPEPASRAYTPEASRTILEDIRAAILADTKNMGRRLTVDEALERYGQYGVEAKEVIASMADKGLIAKRAASGDGSQSSREGRPADDPRGFMYVRKDDGSRTVNGQGEDIAADIGRAVEGIARAIGRGVESFQDEASRSGPPGARARSGAYRDYEGRGEDRIERKIERAMARAGRAVERAGSKMSEKQALARDLERHSEEVGTGKWDAELKDSEHFKPGPEDLETDFSRYRDRVEDKARKSAGGFIGNILSFVGVNAFLWYVNMRWSPGFPWASIVSASWGIGIVANLFAIFRGKAKVAELEKMPELEPDALAVYKKLNRVRDSMASHLSSVLTVPVLLVLINQITWTGFMWSFIPAGIMLLSLIGHLASYPGTKRGLEKKLWRLLGVDSWHELFSRGRVRRSAKAAGQYASVYAEAASVRDDIVRDIKAGSGLEDFGKEMIPTLDRYVEQVKLLSQSVNDIDGIVASIPMDALKADKAELVAKREASASPSLKAEYQRSIVEIETQEKASADLEDKREVLRLRLNSSVNALKQIKIDMARMRALPDSGEHLAIDELRRKASELSGYLSDLKTGYDETTGDPYAELERLAAEADEKKRLAAKADEPKRIG